MVLLIAALCAVISGCIASGKNRSAFGYGALGFFLPIIGIVAICCLPPVKSPEQLMAELEMARWQSRS